MCKVKWASYLSEIKAEPRKWLWPGRIPLGEITLIAGTPGMGKSLITANLTSHITTGKPWPGGDKCPVGDVILLQAEDSIPHTVRPRFDAAGVDPSRIVIIEGAPGATKQTKGSLLPFDLTRDFTKLIYLIKKAKHPLAVIIDPMGSYIGNIDIHRENQVRVVMYMLKQQIAEKYGVAVLVVVHLRKGGIEDPVLSRVLGSVAFTGAARTVWGVAGDKDDPNRRLFIPMKHNLIAGGAIGLEFFISTAPNGEAVTTWGKTISDVADDVMVDHGMRAHGQMEKVVEIIKGALADGPQPAAKVRELIVQEALSWRTAQSAKKQLKIKSQKQGNQWIWSLPPE